MAVLTRTLAVALLASLSVAGWLAWRLNDGSRARAELERVREAEQLIARGQIVAVERHADEIEAFVPQLHAQIDEARATATGARIVRVVQASTGPVPACGQPLPTEPSCRPCLLEPGQQVEIRTAEVGIRYEHGTETAVARSEVVRLEPVPASVIAAGPWSAPVTRIAVEPTQQQVGRWGVGPLVLLSPLGAGLGVLAAAPSAAILGLQVDASLGAAYGAGGLTAMVGAVVRP